MRLNFFLALGISSTILILSQTVIVTAHVINLATKSVNQSRDRIDHKYKETSSEFDTSSFIKSRNKAGNYVVIVDCGSSGTRAHIFKRRPKDLVESDGPFALAYEEARDEITKLPLIKRIKPGLASFKNNYDEASDYMRPIMKYLSEMIPAIEHETTPIHFLGTAGFRLLEEFEQRNILEDLIKDIPKEFDFPLIFTEVIKGSDEGIFQWLSVNAYSNRLGPSHDLADDKDFHHQPKSSRRFGILEMGGASAQVTFEVSKKINDELTKHMKKLHQESLNSYRNSLSYVSVEVANENKTYQVFSSTFLGFGANSARGLAIDLLIREYMKLTSHKLTDYHSQSSNLTSLTLDDPCLPIGGQQLVRKPSDLLMDESKTIGFLVADKTDKSFQVRLIGKGNFFKCKMLLKRMLNVAKRERLYCRVGSSRCASLLIGMPFTPFRRLKFLGLSEYFYTTSEMLSLSGKLNPLMVKLGTAKICASSYQKLLELYPNANRVDESRVLLECFKATWILTWLSFGLRMPYDPSLDIETTDNIAGNPVDWTFGASLRKTYEI